MERYQIIGRGGVMDGQRLHEFQAPNPDAAPKMAEEWWSANHSLEFAEGYDLVQLIVSFRSTGTERRQNEQLT